MSNTAAKGATAGQKELGSTLERQRKNLEAQGQHEYHGIGHAKPHKGYHQSKQPVKKPESKPPPPAYVDQNQVPDETSLVAEYPGTSSDENDSSTEAKKKQGNVGAKSATEVTRQSNAERSGASQKSTLSPVKPQRHAFSLVLSPMAKSPRDPSVVALASELRKDFQVPTAAATRLAILKLTKADEELYDTLLRGVALSKSGFPVQKISRMGKASKCLLRLTDGQITLYRQSFFGGWTNKGRIALASNVLTFELEYKAVDADPFIKYFKSKETEPSTIVDRVALMTTAERPFAFIFEDGRAAHLFQSVVNLHRGIGHKCFELHTSPTSDVFHHK